MSELELTNIINEYSADGSGSTYSDWDEKYSEYSDFRHSDHENYVDRY